LEERKKRRNGNGLAGITEKKGKHITKGEEGKRRP